MKKAESNLLFFIILSCEFLFGALVLDFYFGNGIIHSLILLAFCMVTVCAFCLIRKSACFMKKGILILFGILNILLFLLQQYIITQI